jgi:tRNA threonylcarbamoyladenosine biosynthesis protein TsaE
MTMGPRWRPQPDTGIRLGDALAAAPGESDATVLELSTAADTRAFGRALGRLLRAGDVIILGGPLGAGKTALTQGIGDGLGITTGVVSPTFVIARVHTEGRVPLVHVDAYRLGGLGELDDLDLDVSQEESVTVIEWGTGMAEALSDTHLRIDLARADDSEVRAAVLSPHGGDWAQRIAQARRPLHG